MTRSILMAVPCLIAGMYVASDSSALSSEPPPNNVAANEQVESDYTATTKSGKSEPASFSGIVKWRGEIPVVTPEFDDFGRVIPFVELVVDHQTSGVSNVIVEIFPENEKRRSSRQVEFPNSQTRKLRIVDGLIHPRAIAITSNDRLEIVNDDLEDITLMAGILEKNKSRLDIKVGRSESWKLPADSPLPIRLQGSRAPFMQCYVLVRGNERKGVVTDEKGRFIISDLAPGKYYVFIFHELFSRVMKIVHNGKSVTSDTGAWPFMLHSGNNDAGIFELSSEHLPEAPEN